MKMLATGAVRLRFLASSKFESINTWCRFCAVQNSCVPGQTAVSQNGGESYIHSYSTPTQTNLAFYLSVFDTPTTTRVSL